MYTLIFNTQILIIFLSEEPAFTKPCYFTALNVNITVLRCKLELFQSNTEKDPGAVCWQSVPICKSDFWDLCGLRCCMFICVHGHLSEPISNL